MERLQQKLDFLLEKYAVSGKAVLKNENTLEVNGAEYPLLSHRCERRFIELRNIVCGGTLQGISVMRTARIVEKGEDIYAQLYRELDLCQFILNRKITGIAVMQNGNTLNAIANAEDGVVCTLEIAATLEKGERAKDKHEVISQRGIACDIVVDSQLAQDSIYVFGAEKKKYTDVDFELYGLSIPEIAMVRSAFLLMQNGTGEEMKKIHGELLSLVDAAKRSVKSGEREDV